MTIWNELWKWNRKIRDMIMKCIQDPLVVGVWLLVFRYHGINTDWLIFFVWYKSFINNFYGEAHICSCGNEYLWMSTDGNSTHSRLTKVRIGVGIIAQRWKPASLIVIWNSPITWQYRKDYSQIMRLSDYWFFLINLLLLLFMHWWMLQIISY